MGLSAGGGGRNTGTAGFVATAWVRHHCRQHEVLAREHHQIARINRERREGEITAGQEHAFRASDRAIARQVYAEARADVGYITKAQQRQINAKDDAQSCTIAAN